MSDDSHEAARADEEPGEESPAGAEGDAGEQTVEGAEPAEEGAEPAEEAAETTDGEESADDLVAAKVAQYDEELAEQVASLEEDHEALESEAAELRADLDDAEAEIDDLTSRLKRVQADFQNYKKRQEKRKKQLRERATEDLVENLLPVRDNLVRALDQDEGADIRDGVEATLTELERVLAEENVEAIEPAPGDEVDPQRHEVMMRVESEEADGTVADVYQAGYEMGDRVIRAAQITVSDGDEE